MKIASATAAPSRRLLFAALTVIFGTSGAVALVYEVIWQREFALLFGASGPASATVLAAYFFGLGAGTLCVSLPLFRRFRPLRLYAGLEALLGLGALCVTPLLSAVASGSVGLPLSLASSGVGRSLTAFFILFLPTFCMGATLPVLGPFLDDGRHRLGLSAGWLYAVNTAGASVGTLAFPFLLLPVFGMSASTHLCAFFNFLLAGLALALDSRVAFKPRERGAEPKTRSAQLPPGLFAAAVSGLVTFALQVLWSRALAQVHENAVQSFALVVFVVILSLALGALLARFGLKRGIAPSALLSWSWILGGLAIVLSPLLFLFATRGLSTLPLELAGGNRNAALLLLSASVLFLPLTLAGIALPTLFEAAGKGAKDEQTSSLSFLLGANTAGAVAGALLAGFIIPATLGFWGGLVSVGSLLLFCGITQRPSISQNGRTAWRRLSLLAALWLLLVPASAFLPWEKVTLDTASGEKLLSISESLHGITAVVERPGSRRLKLNNHYGLGGTASTGDERMQGHIPLLLHPSPKEVAFLGLGTGSTAGASLFHPVDHLTVIELVPDVVNASRQYFKEANQGVLDHTRTTVVADDARHFLRTSDKTFDVIIGDLVVPWRQGEGALFTLENFEAARRSLRPGGLYCQWVPLYQLKKQEWAILVTTFLKVFPKAYVWRGDFSPNEPAIALVGTVAPYSFSHDIVARRLREMQRDPLNPHLQTEEGFWTSFAGVLEPETGSMSLPVNREDFPWLEILGPVNERSAGETMTGRTFFTWLEGVPSETTPEAERLPQNLKQSTKAGRVLADMMLGISEGDQTRAEQAQRTLSTLLPASTLKHLFESPP